MLDIMWYCVVEFQTFGFPHDATLCPIRSSCSVLTCVCVCVCVFFLCWSTVLCLQSGNARSWRVRSWVPCLWSDDSSGTEPLTVANRAFTWWASEKGPAGRTVRGPDTHRPAGRTVSFTDTSSCWRSTSLSALISYTFWISIDTATGFFLTSDLHSSGMLHSVECSIAHIAAEAWNLFNFILQFRC
jgi:hypothetical protein